MTAHHLNNATRELASIDKHQAVVKVLRRSLVDEAS
jgi:hypothetical protein